MLTLLFLGVVGLDRTWDLRSYTGDGLALLSGRERAYGYRYTEAFLSQVAYAGGAETLTNALARWTTQLWDASEETAEQPRERTYYIDGHHKPVYSDHFIPRGLVGRSGKILGNRALVLLHDEEGHPRMVTTDRGDQHLTVGLLAIISRYEQQEGLPHVKRIIVDREGMATEFLAHLQADGRTVVTILRTNQYQGLTSFSQVGDFVPLSKDSKGKPLSEVASAQILLSRPDHPSQVLCLQVALIRDLHRLVPVVQAQQEADLQECWDADLPHNEAAWWEEDWQATPAPAKETTSKLIPIVTTAPTINAVEVAQTYTHRWSAQENVIKDYLLPLGLDTNHGFAKVEVPNSEQAKQRSQLEQRLSRLKQWAKSASKREAQASRRYDRLCEEYERHAEKRHQELALYQSTLQGVGYAVLRREIEKREAEISAKLELIRVKQEKAYEQCNTEFRKQEQYCKEQREVLRALEDLSAKERTMYELDNRKDQVMTVCKVALANLAMWVRDQYFPASYAHATWLRLLPFFRLPGSVLCDATTVRVDLRPFNDRALNRDLLILCQRVNEASPRLPDGRHLCFTLNSSSRSLPAQDQQVA